MAAQEQFRQEMPKAGGYPPIDWAKSIPKRGLPGAVVWGGFVAGSAFFYGVFQYTMRRMRREELEMRDANVALAPLLLAERNRLYLKQVRRNRECEEELMKDVPGWVVGTLWGEPVYHNVDRQWRELGWEEFYVHSRWKDMYDRTFERHRH